jgi:hypothetical protein
MHHAVTMDAAENPKGNPLSILAYITFAIISQHGLF